MREHQAARESQGEVPNWETWTNPKPSREEVAKEEPRLPEGQPKEDWEAKLAESTEAPQRQDEELMDFYETQEVNLALDDIPEEGIERSQHSNDKSPNTMEIAGDKQVEIIQMSEIPYRIHVKIPRTDKTSDVRSGFNSLQGL